VRQERIMKRKWDRMMHWLKVGKKGEYEETRTRFISLSTREIRTCHFALHRVYHGAGNAMGFLTILCDMSWIYMGRKNGREFQTIWFILRSTMLMTYYIRHRKRQKHVDTGTNPARVDKFVLVASPFPCIMVVSLICFNRAIVKLTNQLGQT
jgi:hypothetical protein